MSKLDRINPFSEQSITDQLDSWASALEMAVATLNRTLAQIEQFRKGEEDDQQPPGRTGAIGGDDGDD